MVTVALAAVASVSSVSMAGCAADRTAEAEGLRPVLRAMPGVTFADVDYVNDFENGANLDIGLNMSHASIEEIRAAMKRIDGVQRARFDDHRQTTNIGVTDRASVEYGGYGKGLDADDVVADTVAVRELNDRVSADTIRWQHFEDYSSLELTDSTDADADLRAVVSSVPTGSTLVSVVSRGRDPLTSWDVGLPLTLEQLSGIVSLRDRLPVTVYRVDVRDGHVSGLDVNLGDPAAAVEEVREVVAAVAPSQAHPVKIVWRLTVNSLGEIGAFTACSPGGEASPSTPPAPAFAALKQHFELEYTGCGG